MVIVLPWEQTPLGMEMDLEPLSLPPSLQALRISVHCGIRADLMQTRGHLLPPCVWVQRLEGCYLPACVSAPQVLLGHRGHASVCVCVCKRARAGTTSPPLPSPQLLPGLLPAEQLSPLPLSPVKGQGGAPLHVESQ